MYVLQNICSRVIIALNLYLLNRKDLFTMIFFEQWDKLENSKAKVLLQHSLFGRQIHTCDSLRVINDDRLGVILKGQDIFVNKEEIIDTEERNGMYMVSDGRLKILIFTR